MLIMWVRCRVTDREAFTRGQEGWGALADAPARIGSYGGIDVRLFESELTIGAGPGVGNVVRRISGDLVALEPAWTVLR